MPNNKMLIDASHREETRVVVTRGSRIEEFDFESQDKKQLRGNIYLARVTRVEPSLQAAFVEYGGNRHGFLAFSEIHPDYYQIPVADRQALLRAEAEAHEDEDDEDGEERNGRRRKRRGGKNRRDEAQASGAGENGGEEAASESESGEELVSIEAFEAHGESLDTGETVSTDAEETAVSEAGDAVAPAEDSLTERADQPVEEADSEREAPQAAAPEGDEDGENKTIPMSVEDEVVSEAVAPEQLADAPEPLQNEIEEVPASHSDEGEIESVGAEDALEEVRERRRTPRRHYKIQEVIKRRQILLVQVVKEERGNKGAALTTYLSLAGRYSVLMPNTARGGGISRKITNAADRKRLKDVVKDLDVPQGMGVILRTAGENRTKPEIKRDYEYLMRMWETVRTLTLRSTAPALVYEEGSLIKRSVRDLYNKEIDEILVAGDEGYREAKDFMRLLMPSHAKVVQPYRDPTPIFARAGIESQLDRMLQPQVTLKSGGYIIINQTEALVSIDVNSGRSTREHSIEDTALHTNLEAAEEVARQLRLRDLAGLIVIDFIDMEENRNNRAVEKKIKDCLKNDSSMKPCPHCGGTGHVRSDSSVALLVIRAIEEFLLKDARNHITVRTPMHTAFYVLNHKRSTLADFEKRFGVTITLEADETVGSQHYVILRGAVADKPEPIEVVQPTTPPIAPEIEDEAEIEVEAEEDEVVEAADEQDDAEAGEGSEGNGDRKRKRRRRRRGGGRDREQGAAGDAVSAAADGDSEDEDEAEGEQAASGEDGAAHADGEGKKRRRGKRGGRRNRRDDETAIEAGASDEAEGDAAPAGEVIETVEAVSVEAEQPAAAEEAPVEDAVSEEVEAPAVPLSASEPVVTAAIELPQAPEAETPIETEAAPARARSNRRRADADTNGGTEPVVSSTGASEVATDEGAAPKRGGWWQRKSFF
ncbi:MAG: ribonuclease E/G [Mesorhizobium amorphae]|nr:MAG: ribonuclease E/G [Mesorhizobium amorphae]